MYEISGEQAVVQPDGSIASKPYINQVTVPKLNQRLMGAKITDVVSSTLSSQASDDVAMGISYRAFIPDKYLKAPLLRKVTELNPKLKYLAATTGDTALDTGRTRARVAQRSLEQ